MASPFDALRREKYIDLVTYRKSGLAVHTPVWFAEHDGRLYVMTRSDSAKIKRIQNNANVEVAACTVRGRRTGPPIAATATIGDSLEPGRSLIRRKYWLARLPVWSRQNIYLEITPA